mgnify:CR=1 FL=1
MTHYLPGSTIEAETLSAESANRLISPMFLSGGLMLSQVAALTGLEPYTIQNWVKRGFLPPPQNKRYTIRQFCRILLINMLKDSFQLDTVCSLLSYINGHLDDESDDIIDDRTLYLSAADAVGKMFRQSQLSYETVDQACAHAIEGYEEPFPGAKERVRKVLEIMVTAYVASKLKQQAQQMYDALPQENS